MLGFRVWNSKNKRFYDDFSCFNFFSMSSKGGIMGGIYHSENNIPMQSTGLFDSMGQEIFEGDVVEIKDITFGTKKPYLVKSVIDFLRDNPRSGFVQSFTILGNIYENNELTEDY